MGTEDAFSQAPFFFSYVVMLSIRFHTDILSNTTRTNVALSFNRCKANLSQSNFPTFKLKFNGYFKTRIARYSNWSSYFQLSRLQLSGNISPNPRPDEETRQSTDHTCFILKENSLKICYLKVRSLPGHFKEIMALMLFSKFDVFARIATWRNHTWRDPKLAIDGYTTSDVTELSPKREEERFTLRTRLYTYVDGYSSLYRKRNAEFVSREKKNNNTLQDQNYYLLYSIVLQTQQQSHNYIVKLI